MTLHVIGFDTEHGDAVRVAASGDDGSIIVTLSDVDGQCDATARLSPAEAVKLAKAAMAAAVHAGWLEEIQPADFPVRKVG